MPSSTLLCSRMPSFGFALMLPVALVSALAVTTPTFSAKGQTPGGQTPSGQTTDAGRALTINAQQQEANAKTGVFTARGNVQIFYPSRNIQATAAQAQYFSRERKIVLNGNVNILQQGNSIRGESVTYLIDEGRFIATPKPNAQVESIYIITDQNPSPKPAAAPATPRFNPKPVPQNPVSAPAAPRR